MSTALGVRLRPPLLPSSADPTTPRGRRYALSSGLVDVSCGCQKSRSEQQLAVGRDLIDDLSVSGGHHDVWGSPATSSYA